MTETPPEPAAAPKPARRLGSTEAPAVPPTAAPVPPPRPATNTNSRPVIVGVLYLANFFVPFSGLVGVVLAYVWRKEPETPEWERSHYTYLIHTFWISMLVFVLSFGIFLAGVFAMVAAQQSNDEAAGIAVVGLFALMALIWIADLGWFTVRCILSLIKSGSREPMPKPRTWLF